MTKDPQYQQLSRQSSSQHFSFFNPTYSPPGVISLGRWLRFDPSQNESNGVAPNQAHVQNELQNSGENSTTQNPNNTGNISYPPLQLQNHSLLSFLNEHAFTSIGSDGSPMLGFNLGVMNLGVVLPPEGVDLSKFITNPKEALKDVQHALGEFLRFVTFRHTHEEIFYTKKSEANACETKIEQKAKQINESLNVFFRSGCTDETSCHNLLAQFNNFLYQKDPNGHTLQEAIIERYNELEKVGRKARVQTENELTGEISAGNFKRECEAMRAPESSINQTFRNYSELKGQIESLFAFAVQAQQITTVSKEYNVVLNKVFQHIDKLTNSDIIELHQKATELAGLIGTALKSLSPNLLSSTLMPSEITGQLQDRSEAYSDIQSRLSGKENQKGLIDFTNSGGYFDTLREYFSRDSSEKNLTDTKSLLSAACQSADKQLAIAIAHSLLVDLINNKVSDNNVKNEEVLAFINDSIIMIQQDVGESTYLSDLMFLSCSLANDIQKCEQNVDVYAKLKDRFQNNPERLSQLLWYEGRAKNDIGLIKKAFEQLKKTSHLDGLHDLKDCYAWLYAKKADEIAIARTLPSQRLIDLLHEDINDQSSIIMANLRVYQQNVDRTASEQIETDIRTRIEYIKGHIVKEKILDAENADMLVRISHLGVDAIFEGLNYLYGTKPENAEKIHLAQTTASTIANLIENHLALFMQETAASTTDDSVRAFILPNPDESLETAATFNTILSKTASEQGPNMVENFLSQAQNCYLVMRLCESWTRFICSKVRRHYASEYQGLSEQLRTETSPAKRQQLELALKNREHKTETIVKWVSRVECAVDIGSFGLDCFSSMQSVYSNSRDVYSVFMANGAGAAEAGAALFNVPQAIVNVLSRTPIISYLLKDEPRAGRTASTNSLRLFTCGLIQNLNGNFINRFGVTHDNSI